MSPVSLPRQLSATAANHLVERRRQTVAWAKAGPACLLPFLSFIPHLQAKIAARATGASALSWCYGCPPPHGDIRGGRPLAWHHVLASLAGLLVGTVQLVVGPRLSPSAIMVCLRL